MYTTKKTQTNFENIVLTDSQSNVSAVITPARGGMLTGLSKNDKEYIFIDEENYNAPERPRCATPVLFPYVGRIKDEILSIDAKQYHADIHGVVHTAKWNLVSETTENGASVTLSTTSNEETRKTFPFDFEVTLTYTLKGNTVTIDQVYTNCSDKTMPFDFGFHPYFNTSGIENLSFDVNGTTQFNGATGENPPFTGALNFDAMFSTGTILTGCKEKAGFCDSKRGTGVMVRFDHNFTNVVIWTNQKDKFVCVEPWSGLPNALNEGTCGHSLAPKASLKAQWAIDIQ